MDNTSSKIHDYNFSVTTSKPIENPSGVSSVELSKPNAAVMKMLRAKMKDVLILLRDQQRNHTNAAREIASAITYFEIGCMWMNRAMFAEKPYNPAQMDEQEVQSGQLPK